MAELVGLVPLFFIGIDWGSSEHRAVVIDAAGKQLHDWSARHSGEALMALADRILKLTGGVAAACRVAIEVKTGPVVETLLARGLPVYAVNPKQTDRFRDRFMPSGAKDDRRDALVLASAVRTDAEQLTRLEMLDERTARMTASLRWRDELVDERTSLTNRLHGLLWTYFAQALAVSKGDVACLWLWTLLEKAPNPTLAAKLSSKAVTQILKAHHVRRDPAEVCAALRAPSLELAPGVAAGCEQRVRSILPRLRLLASQIKEAEASINEQLEGWSNHGLDSSASSSDEKCEQRDEVILRSLPGVGPITLATLLTEVGEPLGRRDYNALRCLFGVAPITRQSGASKQVQMRRACSTRLRDIAFNWARTAARWDPQCKARYRRLRERGATPARAYRGVIDHLLRVACAMLKNRTAYRAPVVETAAA